MSKPDYNSNFKMKISRSLTDLQNSLDEACRLGLPPNFNNTINNHDEEIVRDYDYKNDVVHLSGSRLLGRLVSGQENGATRNHISPVSFKFQSRSDERGSDNSIAPGDNREMYLNVLRGLTVNRQSNTMRRSRSHDVLSVQTQPGNYVVDVETMNKELMREVRILRQRLVDMDEEMMTLRAVGTDIYDHRCIDVHLSPLREECGVDEAREDLRKKVETYRGREIELLNQLNEAVLTIEEAKYEEMQAMMKAEKTREELENMKIRFSEFVEDSTRKMGTTSEKVEQEVQMAMRGVREELHSVRSEMADRLAECHVLREQLKSSQCEIERLNVSLRRVDADKCNSEHSLETATARAVMQRDEAVAHNNRLQAALDKERSERQLERSISLEVTNELRNRLSGAENCQLNTTQDKIVLTKEADDLRSEMAQLRQVVAGERRREQAEKEAREEQLGHRVRKLEEEMCSRQLHFEQIVGEAEQVMQAQSGMLEKMRRELCANVQDIDGVLEHCREEKEELCWRLSRGNEELESALRRLREAEIVVEEQARALAGMRTQYDEMEATRGSQDEEMIAQMTAKNSLMRTVDVLHTRLRAVRRRADDCNCGAFDVGQQLLEDAMLDHVMSLS